ncbi:hypothetical protein HN281_09550 [Acinetobacter baumannii]|uniref:hypothetical protein n=1 Tax=Acinetobacter baumannii TaxID=470 RepID=UPI00044CBC88|nr:hypothetical protein [Acinetobacter baumannii]EXE01436.1 hypothetical protein J556_3836 [Acinetobacter baumannii 1096934]MBF6799998.1 hypothetical protein [Acinetobacter baumannii]MBF6932075.1 hypothetical protein [Acinetobacter baumannii]HDU7897782.1 hypothetical protein [Acinetobacter baumannii]HDU7898833.1 hypothetical protein [Acinetobacter baumannii]
MDNYKIKVKDEASADEARDLFKKIGYQPDNSSYEPYVGWVAVFEDGSGSFYRHNMNLDECVEITIAQLRDLVVLKRNDVKDATHRDKQQNSIYLTSDKVIYYWQGEWCKSAINKSNDYENYIANSLTPIAQPQDPALISGAEAKLAWANGVDIQIKNVNCVNWYDLDESKYNLDIFDNVRVDFRLKPQTIKLELELPKPFEPEEDCHVYILDDGKTDGYRRYSYEVHGDKGNTFIGIWRTEEEIKQVVEQLRKIRGTNS